MKRLVLLFLLVLIPFVSAEINIEGPSKDVYNLGDSISVKGYIIETEDAIGFLKVSLDCEQEIPVITKSISVKKDTKKNFDEQFVIPFYIPGNCGLKVSLEAFGNVIEQARSKEFTISKDLKGNFEVQDKLIQLGKDIEIEGSVYKLDGENIDGNAIVYFKQNDTIYNVGSSLVNDGKFSYVVSSVAYPSGIYNIELEVIDIFGNGFIFSEIEPFTLVNEIYVFAKPNKLSVLPGTVVTIFGEAKTILQDKIEDGKVTLNYGDKGYETELDKSKFEYEIVIEDDVKSGRHDIEIIVEDPLGNIGRTSTNFNVNAIPTSLYVDTEVNTFIPGTKMRFKPVLLDQGGDFIIEDISVEILDSDDDVVFNKVVKTNEMIEYEFEQYAEPGTWVIKTYATGLVNDDQIYVGETLAADFSLEGQILKVVNIGNVVYKRPIEIRLENEEEYVVVKKKRLSPGDSYDIDLGENVKSGVYDVFVGDKEFNDVEISGFVKRDYSWLYWILIIIVLLLILFLFWRGIHKRKRKKKEEKHEEEHLAERVKDFLKGKGLHHNKKEEKKEESKKDRMERYKKEFRERILKDISKREKKIRQDVSKFLPKEKQDYIELKAPEEKKRSLMDIFTMKNKKTGGEK